VWVWDEWVGVSMQQENYQKLEPGKPGNPSCKGGDVVW